jgi:hypothetical protein
MSKRQSAPPRSITPADLDNRDFTYCQVFFYQRRPAEYFLVGTPFKREAKPRAWAHAQARWGEQIKEICLYPRTYVDAARKLLGEGKVEELPQTDSSLDALIGAL